MKHLKFFYLLLCLTLSSFTSVSAEDGYTTTYVQIGRQSAVVYQPLLRLKARLEWS